MLLAKNVFKLRIQGWQEIPEAYISKFVSKFKCAFLPSFLESGHCQVKYMSLFKKNQLRGTTMQVIFKLTGQIHYFLFSAPLAKVLSPAYFGGIEMKTLICECSNYEWQEAGCQGSLGWSEDG